MTQEGCSLESYMETESTSKGGFFCVDCNYG